MEKLPKQEESTTVDIQLKLNKDLRGLAEKEKLLNAGDVDWAEEILVTIDSLMQDKNVQNSKEDIKDLEAKRKRIVKFIDRLHELREKWE